MNASETERELDELEMRIERLRALYEQYFMGLEKLEPLIPRKDVDRRIWILRRVQVRNTGLRFKFQMLIQRYNTFQQYWLRVTREIENGTYRRDVVRAAKRFGAKDAMTILGRKRAQKYAELAAIQAAQSKHRRGRESEFEELSDADLLQEEDEYEELLSGDELVEDDDAGLRDEDVNSLLEGLYSKIDALDARGEHEEREEKTIPAPAFEGSALARVLPRIPKPPLMPSVGVRSSRVEPAAPFFKRPRVLDDDDDAMETTVEFREPLPPPKPSDPEAAKRRLLELAAQMKSERGLSKEELGVGGPLELDLDFDQPQRPSASRKSTKPPPKRASATKMPAVRASSAPSPARSGSPASRRTTRGMRAVRVSASDPPSAARHRAQPAHSGSVSKGEDLGDQRLEQIYAKYIETRRGVNEPVAGMTYEKVSESLRTQAEKLRAMHPGKLVDYEVVVKNGKTLIKPILR